MARRNAKGHHRDKRETGGLFHTEQTMSNVTNYGFQCDRCEYITQSEDDHIITDDGEYLCLECNEKRVEEKGKEKKKTIFCPCPRC